MAAEEPPTVPSAEADNSVAAKAGAGEDRLVMYRTKVVQFLGRSTPIILQNDNGPCPLLAICNVLLLRNVITLSSDVPEVSQDQLLALVADRLVDSNIQMKSKDEEYLSNQQQNISDAIDLLPHLATGIDVNVHFRKINDFEFTRECAIFDLLDIGLYHGWIVDPEDKDTARAIGSKSYNTLVGELVALEAQISEDGAIPPEEEDTVDFAAATAATLGIPHPSLSRGQSFDDRSTSDSTDKVARKGDLEEEEELMKVLELSKCEVSTELIHVDKSMSPESRSGDVSSDLEDGAITRPSDPIASISTEKVGRKGDLEEGKGPMKAPTLLGPEISMESVHIDKSVSSESRFGKLSSDLEDGTVAGTSDETIDGHRTIHSPSLPLSKGGDSSESSNTETSFGVVLENNTQSMNNIIADHRDQSVTMQSEVICHPASESNIPISQPSTAVAAVSDGSNVSGDEKIQMNVPTGTSSLLTEALPEKDLTHSVDQNNGDFISPGVSQSNVGSGRESANGHGSACSDLEDREPIYEGEECILDPGRSAYQSQEPVYEGEVVLANQVDKMESKATSTKLDKEPFGRKNDGLTAISLEEGRLIHCFLKSSASQLTIYGLFRLQEGLNERELCVFFRNNHFSTMFKFRGELYLLATDQGYVNQPDLVWEKLNEVNGNTIFMTGNFLEFKMDIQNDSWSQQNAMTDTTDYLATIKDSTSQGSSLSSDLQLAIALQEQELGRQPVCPEPTNPQPTNPQHTPVQRSRLVTGPQVPRRQPPKPEPKSKDKCVVM